MDRSDPAYRGQREYTPLFLRMYDPVILGVLAPVVWRCPASHLLGAYRRHTGHRHLDVGPGTGYFLDKAAWPVANPAITLVDLNENSLAFAADRIKRYAPRTVRANALEDNVVLYKVEGGKRTDLPLRGEGRTYGKKSQVPAGQWSTLRVVANGPVFEVYFNGSKLYEVEDTTFSKPGKVGLWTKADSVTQFDDLTITTK